MQDKLNVGVGLNAGRAQCRESSCGWSLMQGELNVGGAQCRESSMWGWGLMQGELNVGVGLNAGRALVGGA